VRVGYGWRMDEQLMGEVERDPRWEWVHVPTYGDPDQWVRGCCRHVEVVPVTSVAGEVVAQLCLTCDGQFDPPVIAAR
jgi:hypothetical protein